jgi:DNA-directed RNA polymerase subunit RPC12/RpoP
MPADEDLLFGRLVISEGYCTQAQIDECVRMQSYAKSNTALGELLLFKGYITAPQHDKILELQKRTFEAVDPLAKKRKEALLFGKLATREGLLTEDEVNDCLREQAKEGEKRSLGEIMVSKSYLTVAQIQGLLGKQLKKLMTCLACNLSFTVLSLSQGKQVDCPRCKGPLQERKVTKSSRTDAEFATQVVRTVKAGLPAGNRPETRVIPPSAKSVKAKCVICDHRFEGTLDSTGRLRCPSCNTTFAPK